MCIIITCIMDAQVDDARLAVWICSRIRVYIYVQYQLHPSGTGTLAPSVALHLASASTPTAYHLVAFVYSVHPMHHLRAELYIVPGPSRLSRILAKAEAADERSTCRHIPILWRSPEIGLRFVHLRAKCTVMIWWRWRCVYLKDLIK